MDNPLSDQEFELANLAEDHIDDWLQSKNKRLRRINLRRWNRVLKMLGEPAYPSQYARVKPADLASLNKWVTGMADEFRPVYQYVLGKESEKANVRLLLVDGKVAIRDLQVTTNLGFFQEYCDSQSGKGTPDAALEGMIRVYAAAIEDVVALADNDFAALCAGRRETAEACLAALFGDAGSWVATPVSIAEELKESRDNLAQWEEWEKEDEERREAAQEALRAWKNRFNNAQE